MAKKGLGYRYTPEASKLFQPARVTSPKTPEQKREDTISSLSTQQKNLTRRFERVGQEVPAESDGQAGLLGQILGETKGQVDKRNILEKALNLKPEQNVLMDILELMDRPRQVVANVLSAMGDEDERDLLTSAWEGLSGRKRLSTKEALQNLTGDDQFLETPEQEGWLDEAANFIVDMGLDILADPTTYLGFGVITKALGGATKWTGKTLVELGEAGLKSTDKAAKAFGSFVDFVKKTSTKIRYALDAKYGMPDEIVKALDELGGNLGTKARQYKLTLKQLRDELAKYGDEGDRLYKQLFESNTRVRTGRFGRLSLETPDATVKLKTVVEDMLGNFKNKKIRAYILPEVRRWSKRNTGQVDDFVRRLNDAAGQPLFKKKFAIGKDGVESVSIEISQGASKREVQEALEGLLAQTREKGSLLRKQITFKGAIVDTPEMKKWIEKVGVKKVNELLATGQDLTRQSRELLSDMGKYRIGGETFQEGTRYMRRVITEEGKEFIGKRSPFVKQAYKKPGADVLKGRTYSNALITSEINSAMENLYGAGNDVFNESAIASLNDLINVTVEKVGQRDALSTLLGVKVDVTNLKRSRSIVAKKLRETNTNFFKPIQNTTEAAAELGPDFRVLTKKEISREFSNLYNNLPEEFRMVWDDMMEIAGAGVEGNQALAMNKSVYNVLAGYNNAYRELPEFIKYYDGFLNTWKEVNLLSPAFNGRNFLGNSMNMYVSGMGLVDQTRYTTQAWFDLKRYDDLSKKVALDPYNMKNTLTPEELQFMDEVGLFFNEGISQSYKNTRDLDTILKRIEDEASGKIPKAKGAKKVYRDYVDFNFKTAERIDNMQRYAMWKWKKSQLGKINPGNPNNGFEAAKAVKEALFDYTNLTPTEMDYMKRLIPFYTFFKNNLVFQAKNITRMPNQYKKMLRAYKYWGEDIADLKQEDLPDYMAGNMWLPIPLDIDGKDQNQIAFLKANLPFSDFTEFIDQPLKKGVSSVSVPIKLTWELASGRELFTGAPIENFAGEADRMEDPDNLAVLSQLRGKNGELYLSGNPIFQKIADELGFRTPRRLASAIFDVLDTASGQQTTQELVDDIFDRAGFTTVKTGEELQLNALYQQVEKLRNLKKLYEQNVGELPTLPRGGGQRKPLVSGGASVPNRAQYLYRPK